MQQLGWIHFSPKFRDRINAIMDRLGEEGVIDELGVGIYRDALGDYFFPGTSTVQTRAKYFFITCYLIRDFLKDQAAQASGLDRFLLEQEHKIMWRLAKESKHDRRAGSGVIGITKRQNEPIARRPSSIYWNGLRMFDFIEAYRNESQSQFAHRLKGLLGHNSIRHTNTNGLEDDTDVNRLDQNVVKVSTYHPKWQQNLSLSLNSEEAAFFRDRIKTKFDQTLLGQLLLQEPLRDKFFQASNFPAFVRTALTEPLTEELKTILRLAHDLNLIIQGLHLVYCDLIHQRHYPNTYSGEFAQEFASWANDLYGNLLDPDNLLPEIFNELAPNAYPHTRQFLAEVLDLVRHRQVDFDQLAKLVTRQEIAVKAGKARLRPHSVCDFDLGKPRSLASMNYRFDIAKRIIRDIINGLGQTMETHVESFSATA